MAIPQNSNPRSRLHGMASLFLLPINLPNKLVGILVKGIKKVVSVITECRWLNASNRLACAIISKKFIKEKEAKLYDCC
jgi:uncharacterized paraquat-inducible protein A